MSTTIDVIYDDLLARLKVLFPDHLELFDSTNIDQNPITVLKKGLALDYGPGEPGPHVELCRVNELRQFVVTFTRHVDALEFDAAKRALAKKAVMTDASLLQKEIVEDNLTISGANLISYLGDNGVESVFSNKQSYVMTRANLSVSFTRDLG